jgi:DNA-binding GntR family transcriptional regulator
MASCRASSPEFGGMRLEPPMSQTRVAKRVPLSVTPVQRATMQEDVYRQARECILNGDIQPGQSITIQWLADAFGVSAMPVREAILRLTAERALTVVAGRSLGIPPLTRERLRDLTRTRLEIEALAVSWAAPSFEAHRLRRLRELIREMETVKPDSEARRVYLRANREFHFTIYQASGSEVLSAIVEGLWLQVSPYFNLLHEHGNFPVSNHHHMLLVEALERGDIAQAVAALRSDIMGAADMLDTLLA